MQFSAAQKEAIETIDGQVLVIACPGSGKTTMLIHRVKHMVESGIDPKSILAMTFSNAAAAEMDKRYKSLCTGEPDLLGVKFQTFHSFCYNLIKNTDGFRDSELLGDGEQITLIYNIVRELAVDGLLKGLKPKQLSSFRKACMDGISACKSRDIDAEQFTPAGCKQEDFVLVFNAYQERKKMMDRIDYDDMLVLCRQIFIEQPQILAMVKNTYKYILVDEYQDTNKLQKDILYMIAGKDDKANICVVGDDDQSIYAFRGADFRIFLDFPKQYPACRKITMDTNYRSEPSITQHARTLIEHNKERFPKNINASKTGDAVLECRGYKQSTDEAKGIADQIEELMRGGLAPEGIAVLARNNNQLNAAALTLSGRKIPFYMKSVIKSAYEETFFDDLKALWRFCKEKPLMKDFLTIIQRPARYLPVDGLMNIQPEEIAVYQHVMQTMRSRHYEEWRIKNAKKAIGELFRHLEKMKGLSLLEFIRYMRGPYGYDFYIERTEQEMNSDPGPALACMETYENDVLEHGYTDISQLSAYGEMATALIHEANNKKAGSGVTLSTMHSSKGLEWDAVFIIGANDEVVPSPRMRSDEQIEEERRLFYVACTRAKKILKISWKNKPGRARPASRFCYELNGQDEEANEVAIRNKPKALKVKKGSKLRHNEFGDGEVISVTDKTAKVKFINHTILKTLSLYEAKGIEVTKY